MKLAFATIGFNCLKVKKTMSNLKVKELSKKLKNVGPKLAQKLISAGIDSPEKLRAMGAKAAFEKMYKDGDKYGDYNAAYLYALEGAIRGCDWLKIPKNVKAEYKKYAQELQKKHLGSNLDF